MTDATESPLPLFNQASLDSSPKEIIDLTNWELSKGPRGNWRLTGVSLQERDVAQERLTKALEKLQDLTGKLNAFTAKFAIKSDALLEDKIAEYTPKVEAQEAIVAKEQKNLDNPAWEETSHRIIAITRTEEAEVIFEDRTGQLYTLDATQPKTGQTIEECRRDIWQAYLDVSATPYIAPTQEDLGTPMIPPADAKKSTKQARLNRIELTLP